MKQKLSKITVVMERFGATGFIVTVKKGWHKNTKHVAETKEHLQKTVKEAIEKSFGTGI